MGRDMSPTNLSTKRRWIAELARRKPGEVLTSLHHMIDLEWMQKAYELTRKDGATGIDGVMADEYEVNLGANLTDLTDRIKSGRYQAPPVRRTYIPKADGSQRPLGIPTLEDKVAQRAIVMVLEAVYEQDFLSCSHGFRPGRSAHGALRVLYCATTEERQHWVLDVDIRKYFDSIPHHHLRAILDQRVTDGVIRRMIDKWLKAGVLEDGLLHFATEGTPQGDVISPMLSNIYLHHVLDEWFASEVRPRLTGSSTLVRQTTAKSRLARALVAVAEWCRKYRHWPLPVQHARLSAKLKGHYAYYGITGNRRQLHRYRQQVAKIWRKWLERRTRSKRLTWARFNAFLARRPLPPAR